MFWHKKNPPKSAPSTRQAHLPLSQPSTRLFAERSKRMEICWPCYLYVESTGYLVPATTLNVSKSGILARTLRPLEHGQEVLCLITNKKKMTKLELLNSKDVMKGKIVRVERQELIYRIAIQINLGPVNPFTFLGFTELTKDWCSR